jgi:hypothetical protein
VDRNLFAEHYAISEATLETARLTRTDDRALQNARTLYKCLKNSIEGDLRSILFDQDGNLPTHEDGPLFFKRLTSFTMAASLQLSVMSFQSILDLDPAEHNFNVPAINTKLNHLFVLATTRERNLTQEERIQHALTVYARIKQPELWAQWVRTQVDLFDAGTLNNCQAFMNAATLKFIKISAADAGFEGSATTVQEDIVAMVAATKRKKPFPPSDDSSKPAADSEKKVPPFVKHFKSGTSDDATAFKVGNKKEWNGASWYFCDCPTHKDRHKWHTHTHEQCRTRKKWLADGGNLRSPPVAQVATDTASEGGTQLTAPTAASSTHKGSSSSVNTADITAMLAAALSLAGNNSAAKDAIADALNAIHDV